MKKKMLLPKVGLGTWGLRGKKVQPAIKAALEAGYKHIDTAIAYTNEKAIGKALENLNVKREDIFITSKIMPPHFSGNTPYKKTLRSIKRLKTDYIDLMLLHAPFTKKEKVLNAYRKLLQAKKEGKVKHVGVSNFSIEHLKWIKEEFGEYPYVNQFIVAPTSRRVELEEFCKTNNINITGYSTMKSYFNPNPFYKGSGMTVAQKAVVDKIAMRYGKNAGQVLLKWSMQLGYHIIPKSANPARVATNMQLNDFELTQDEMKELNSWNTLSDDKIMEKFENTMTGVSGAILSFLMKILM